MKNRKLMGFIVFSIVVLLSVMVTAQISIVKKSEMKIVQIKPDLIIKSINAGLKRITPAGQKNGWVKCTWDIKGSINTKWAIKLYADRPEVGAAWIEPGDPNEIKVPWQGGEGMHEFGCTLDWEYSINELNEKNNKMITLMDLKKPSIRLQRVKPAIQVLSTKPDISILDLLFAPKVGTKIYAGMEAFYRCDWKREGPIPANGFVVRRYINNRHIGTTAVRPNAMSGAASSVVTVPAGRSTLKCIVDQANTVPESNEDNNEMVKTVEYFLPVIEVAESRTDIIATKVFFDSGTSTPIRAGDDVFFRCNWKREGPQPANSFVIKRYIDTKLIGSSTILPHTLSGSASSVVKAPLGKHKLKCVVDSENDVTEVNEWNNRIISYSNLLPRLRVIKPSNN